MVINYYKRTNKTGFKENAEKNQGKYFTKDKEMCTDFMK